MKSEFKSFPLLNYKGPSSFSTLFVHHAGREGIDAASIVARVPPYIETFNAKIGCEYLRKVLSLTSLNIDLSDLQKTGETVNKLMENDFRQDMNAVAKLRQLEEMYDATLFQESSDNRAVNINELIQETLNIKKERRKPH